MLRFITLDGVEPFLFPVPEQHRLAAATTSAQGADAEPAKKSKPTAQSIGELALKQRDTAQEAANYVNTGSYPSKGFRATHHDKIPAVGPHDWKGQARDDRYLVIHGSQDAASKP